MRKKLDFRVGFFEFEKKSTRYQKVYIKRQITRRSGLWFLKINTEIQGKRSVNFAGTNALVWRIFGAFRNLVRKISFSTIINFQTPEMYNPDTIIRFFLHMISG